MPVKGKAAHPAVVAARMIGAHRQTLSRAIQRGQVRAVKIGRRCMVSQVEIDRIIGESGGAA
jgi:hypothetical protein